MQISVPFTPSNIPSISPFYHTISHRPKPIQRPPRHLHIANSLNSPPFDSASYLSSIGRVIEEQEEYRKARSEVIRKGVELEGYSIEGLSIGGHETCLIVPEFKCAFDIGRCPVRAIHQNFVFITHAHLDHIVSFFTCPITFECQLLLKPLAFCVSSFVVFHLIFHLPVMINPIVVVSCYSCLGFGFLCQSLARTQD